LCSGICHRGNAKEHGQLSLLALPQVGHIDSGFVGRDQFRLTRGLDMIETIAPPPGSSYMRSFCKGCGTSLGEPLSPDEAFPINAQCLDGDPGLRISYHEFTSDAPAWAPAGQMGAG
jgi:Uncharacterized conserved protein